MFYVNYHPRSGLILNVSHQKGQDSIEISEEEYIDFMTNPGAITSYWVSVSTITGTGMLIKQVQNNFSANPAVPLALGKADDDYGFYVDVAAREITLTIRNQDDVNRKDIRIHGILAGDPFSDVQTVVFPQGVLKVITIGKYPSNRYVWYIERPCIGKIYGITYSIPRT